MTNRWILRGAAVVLALSAAAFVVGMACYVRLSHSRRASLEDWNRGRCEVYRASVDRADDPCAETASAASMPAFRAAHAKIAHARAAIARGDDPVAVADLSSALESAHFIERRSSLLATTLAARTASDVLDVLDANPHVARRPEMRAALARNKLVTPLRPLEAERLRAVSAAIRTTPRTAILTWGATHMRVAEAIENQDATLLTMQQAARRGDRAACERIARRAPIGPGMCASLVKTAQIGRRLERARY